MVRRSSQPPPRHGDLAQQLQGTPAAPAHQLPMFSMIPARPMRRVLGLGSEGRGLSSSAFSLVDAVGRLVKSDLSSCAPAKIALSRTRSLASRISPAASSSDFSQSACPAKSSCACKSIHSLSNGSRIVHAAAAWTRTIHPFGGEHGGNRIEIAAVSGDRQHASRKALLPGGPFIGSRVNSPRRERPLEIGDLLVGESIEDGDKPASLRHPACLRRRIGEDRDRGFHKGAFIDQIAVKNSFGRRPP